MSWCKHNDTPVRTLRFFPPPGHVFRSPFCRAHRPSRLVSREARCIMRLTRSKFKATVYHAASSQLSLRSVPVNTWMQINPSFQSVVGMRKRDWRSSLTWLRTSKILKRHARCASGTLKKAAMCLLMGKGHTPYRIYRMQVSQVTLHLPAPPHLPSRASRSWAAHTFSEACVTCVLSGRLDCAQMF